VKDKMEKVILSTFVPSLSLVAGAATMSLLQPCSFCLLASMNIVSARFTSMHFGDFRESISTTLVEGHDPIGIHHSQLVYTRAFNCKRTKESLKHSGLCSCDFNNPQYLPIPKQITSSENHLHSPCLHHMRRNTLGLTETP
jgi:hypothetical protein